MTFNSPLLPSIYVAIGGGIGALLRYHLGRAMSVIFGAKALNAFPWATLCANVLGSLAMGVLAGWLARQDTHDGEMVRLLLGVGLLGGFTTFSSFSLEMVTLIERGQIASGASYALASFLAGVGGLYIGLIVMRTAQ